ncbi:exo-arabinanase abnx-penicillium chrysogenum [Eremomyces bilateralis CBS 781.70]|uniref:Exo-arabinanase abnx-penicillium chrysogenum n=1 Tax=Eremomyces bilateralis CBS 781.70 TaxID=1392243 RepID=A0A6G1FUH6_9PEZI|nr:exo-arabinanase abnx-penicillium chrysogenum [Eremomyces bilateralis CBS 781.70]KAF1809319.1 exo-arabinanase abnx-penicillium chrysogenum [Eremomyces bilateralis CBS 781.70]
MLSLPIKAWLVAAAAIISTAVSTPVDAQSPPRPQTRPHELSSVVIHSPPRNYTDPHVLYARTVQLPNNDLLATWENYSPEPPLVHFPIYRSADSGETWAEIARVQDTELGVGLRYQPFLYLLPETIGGFKKGTLLLAGSAIPMDLSSTQLELYASKDWGRTWEFVSHVAKGGVAIPNNGETPVWEPFLMTYQKKLIYYYADQRDNATYGQKLSHQTSSDLINWGPPVTDVAYPTYTDRPGMPTVAYLPNGQYIYVYEYGGGPNPTEPNYSFPVFYRLSKNPEKFNDAPHHPIVSKDGTVPDGSPYVVWTPVGGKHGTIVVSCGTRTEIFINKALGAEDAWEKVATPEGKSYTRSLLVFQQDPRYLLIAGAGKLPPSTTNDVTGSVVKLD